MNPGDTGKVCLSSCSTDSWSCPSVKDHGDLSGDDDGLKVEIEGDGEKVVVEGEADEVGESSAMTWTRGGIPGSGVGGFGRGRSKTE